LAGLLTDSLKAGEVDLHDRTEMGEDAHLAGLNLWRGNSLGRIGVIKPSCCFDGKLARNGRFVRWERGKSQHRRQAEVPGLNTGAEPMTNSTII
jgi:hypothetical protein